MRIKASYLQERLWFIHRFESENRYRSGPVYHNIPLILEIKGTLDPEVIEQGLQIVVKRHEALRTRMIIVEGELFQQMEPKMELNVQILDLNAGSSKETNKPLLEFAIEEAKRPFSLDVGSLIRAVLIKISPRRSFLVITLHHLVSDRYSLGVIAAELARCWQALQKGQSPRLPDITLDYADFSQWQRELPQDFLEEILLYWKRKLTRLNPLELPTSKPRAALHTFQEARAYFQFPGPLSTKIREFSQKKGTGNYCLLLAGFKVLLHHYCRQEDIVVGTTVDNRHHPGTETMVGPAANLLVLRTNISSQNTFTTSFSHLTQILEQARENQDIPFDLLALELNPQKDMSRTVFFDILFQYEEEPFNIPACDGLDIKYIETNLGWGRYDLNLLIRGGQASFTGILVYNRDYYEDSFISDLLSHYRVLLESILKEPDRPVSQLNMLSPEERERLLVKWNQTRAHYPEDKTIHQLFTEQVQKTPDNIALEGTKLQNTNYKQNYNISVTYRELNEKSSQLAVLLREKGVKPDTLVAIMLNPSVEMIIGLIGILKAGGAYLPIDTEYPEERIKYILEDSEVKILVKKNKYFSNYLLEKVVHIISIDEPSVFSSSPFTLHLSPATSIAYVIYTSGTTGRPKGCLVSHRNLVRLFKTDQFPFPLHQHETWVMAHSFCFDFSVWEMYGALLNGGRLFVPSLDQIRDINLLLLLIKRYRVTILNQTPQAFYALANAERQSREHSLNYHLHTIIFGGDKLLPQNLSAWSDMYSPDHIQLVNMYGITETTVHVTYYRLKESDIRYLYGISSIGKPLPETTLYILDNLLNPVPVGISAEIFVGGTGVARGYLNQPELTCEKFKIINKKLLQGVQGDGFLEKSPPGRRRQKIYKTGDLGRRLPDGNVEYLGRNDDQVQIRGFRIEPAEIENHLLNHPVVKEAVVMAREDKNLRNSLCAYICLIPGQSLPLISRMREFLSKRLPHYMIPSYFVPVNTFPLTPNGKVDKKALPGPHVTRKKPNRIPPRNPMEDTLAEIWAEVLEMKKELISMDDDFFDCGGHSLKAVVLIARVQQKFKVKIPMMVLFQEPQIKKLVEYITGQEQEYYYAIEPAEKKEYYPLSPTQKRLFVLHQLVPNSTGYNVTYTIPLEAHTDKEKLETIFKRLIAGHESLRTSFLSIGQEPGQIVHKEVEFKIEYHQLLPGEQERSSSNCQGRGEVSSPVKIESIIREFIRPFDLSCAPLLRVGFIEAPGTPSAFPDFPSHQGKENKYLLILDMHHIITDAASLNILEREFVTLYENPDKEPVPLRLQYKDFSEWVNAERQKTLKKQQELYWIKEFSHELTVLNLPTDYPRPLMQSFEGNRVIFAFDPRETKIIKEITRNNGVTLFMCLLAVFNILFSKLSGKEDIIIGTPIAARRHADLQHIIGMLVNTLPLRNYPSANKTFLEFLQEVKQRTLEAYENQEYPFEELVDHLAVNRDTSRNPVFDVMLNLLNQLDQDKKGEMREVPHQPPYEHHKATSRFDLVFSAMELGEQIYFFVEYSTRLFLPNTVERFITYLKNIVRDLPKHIESRLSNIQILSGEEKCKLIEFSAGPEERCDNARTISGMFEEQEEKTPDRIALKGIGMEHMSYRKLNRESNRLAYLLKGSGVGRDTVVGLMKDRSIEMIMGILAILKAGGAYLPLDPQYPQQRIETMLNDSGATILLTNTKELASFSITGLKNIKARNKNIVVTPARDQITNFDRLPIPDRTLIDYKKYHQYIGEAPAKHTITLQTTRGCPYHCLYCHKIWPKKHVTRSAENIFKEISYAYEAGIRRFVFIDDIFNLDRKNSVRFLETIIKNKKDIQLFFPNGFRADILDRDFIDLMAAAGTVNLDVALESASPRIQKLIRKNLNLEKFKENVQYITETYPDIILEMEMMHGFPTETEEEAIMTLDFLKSFKWVHFPNLHILKIFPNTDICRLAIENGISQEAIERSAALAFHELPDTLPFSKNFTRQFQAKFMGEYFLSKERLLHVLTRQMKILTVDELVQKYDSYLSSEIKHFDDILRYTGISREELGNGDVQLIQEEQYQAPDFLQKISQYFPVKTKKPLQSAFRILLLDLSQLFSEAHEYMLHHQIEEPLGLLYLMTYLKETFKNRINGKIFKSMIDFDSYDELKTIIFDFKPDLIGIRTLSFYKEFFHKAVLMIRQWGMDVPIVAGGPYATSDYHLILQDPHVDAVVLGEGELTLAHLVEKMMENNNQFPGQKLLHDIQGIAFRSREHQWNIEEKTRDILLPDEIPGRLNRYSTANIKSINQADDLLYVIYTSGSTGIPKGVMLQHGNLVNLIRWQYNHTDIDFSRVLQFTSIGFDVSAQEIFSTLLAGGVLSMVSREMLSDIPRLFLKVKNDQIKTLFLPTSFLKFVMNEEDFLRLIPDNIDHIVTAGEQAIVNQSFKHYLKENHVYFHNHYGPSETHVVTALSMSPGEDIKKLPPIGRPVLNTSIYILDKGYHPVPVGIPGELFIAGLQVGRGYLNRPELTFERFDHDLWDSQDYHNGNHRSSRSHKSYNYRTGDLARWLPEGNIEFLGRSDHQVKIRGFRVELGEIESKLLNHQGIKEAVVQARTSDSGEKYLCAYIAAKSDNEPTISTLQEYLSRKLPEYMIPAYFVKLDELPLTPNRKIDRNRLPDPGLKSKTPYAPPQDVIEEKLLHIWSEVLAIEKDKISTRANFFQMGGHSLKASNAIAKIRKEFNMEMPLSELFKTPTIRSLAKYIKISGIYTPRNIIVKDENLALIKPGKNDLYHLFFVHYGSGEVEAYVKLCLHLDDNLDFNCWGIKADKLNDHAPQNLTIEKIASQYIPKIKSLQPRGPYFIAGWCMGGTIAFEIVRQLEMKKEDIAFFALINSPSPRDCAMQNPLLFTMESEKDFIKKYLPIEEVQEKLEKITEINEIWPFIIDYLEAKHFDVDIIRKIIVEYEGYLVPDYQQLSIRQLIKYLNVGRILQQARAAYIPESQIHTPVHYFAATQENKISKESWNDYCCKPIKFYEITGNHYSILKEPQVIKFGGIFSKIVKKFITSGEIN